MATIINNPDNNGSGGMGMVVGAVVVLAVFLLFFFYGFSPQRGDDGGTRSGDSGTTVNVPDKIEVDVKDSAQ